ncbi:hypothetical protein ACQR1I_30990 [Bradyrhizobium sp. HKCCYLS2038]|uniref:hypothetical protein n=1 Tax=unclassified Bradyrhizobium TaxID=2631580 RepID=UPI003EB79658
MRRSIVLLMLLATPVSAQPMPPAGGPITCTSPVSVGDSAKSLMQRYGGEAVVQDDIRAGVEEITYRGVALFTGQPDRRIDVAFVDEDALRGVSRLTLHDARTSRWSVAGVTLGATLAEVQRINGRPFRIISFDSELNGFVADWGGGMVGRGLPGGCTLKLRFGADSRVPAALAREGRGRISSDDAMLRRWAPVVEQIKVRFATK